MGIYSYGYKAAKTPIGKKVVDTVKNIFTSKKTSPTITSVTPNVPVTKGQKLKRDLTLQKRKTATSGVRLDNTMFRIKQEQKKLEKMKTEKKAKGGRIGYSKGTPRRKTDVEKIKKTFGTKKDLGMQSIIYGLDKNPDVTKADPKAKFIAAAMKKKKKKKVI
jgi:hypothetical protein